MPRCRHCGKEIEESQQFCPFCGQATSASVVEQTGANAGTELASTLDRQSTSAVARAPQAAMSSFERSKVDGDKSGRTIFLAVALVSAVLVGGLIWWATRPAARTAEPRLEGALRPGSAEFEEVRGKLIVEFDPDEHAFVNERALGDVVLTLKPTIRNFTGKTITGLELRALALDLADQPIKTRTVLPIPNQLDELAPNKTFAPSILLEGIPQDNRPANLRIELTGVQLR
jgi:hypothetical protein